MPDLASPDAKQVERHHFNCLHFAARNSFQNFNILTFLILNPSTFYSSTSTHSFDILIHVIAYQGISEAPGGIFTRDFLHRCRYIAVAQIWTFRERKLGKSLEAYRLVK